MEGFTGEVTNPMDTADQVRLSFTDILSGHEGKCEVTFTECADAADCMLIAFPDLVRLGFGIEDDDDGLVWVTLKKVGVTLLAEIPDRDGPRDSGKSACRAVEPRILDGPCVDYVDAWFPGPTNKKWVAELVEHVKAPARSLLRVDRAGH